MWKKKDKKDKKDKDTPDKKGTVRPPSDSKSPRVEGGASSSDIPDVTEEIMVFNCGDTKLALTHRKLLSDQTFYDMELSLGGHHRKAAPVRAHRAVLQIRVPSLLQEGKFVGKIERNKHGRQMANISEAALPHMSPTVLSQLMIYIYSGTMEVSRFSLPTLLDMCATGSALGLDEVVWMCEHKVREQLVIDTVHSILKGAEDRKLEGVKNFTLEYSFTHWGDFIGNQEGAKILGLELFQDVSAKYAKGEKVTYPEGAQPDNTIIADYRRLFEEMPAPDLQLEVGSEKLPCHRAILAMYSDALGHFLSKLKHGQQQSVKLVESEEHGGNGEVKSASALVSLLRFVYYGEVKMDPIDACEMIHKVNSVYKLNTFQLLCEHTIINNIDARSVIPILGVTYIPGFSQKTHIQALRKQALGFIISQFGTTDLSALSSMPAEIRTDLLLTLQDAFKSGKLGQALPAAEKPAAAAAPASGGADEEVAVAVDDSE